MFQFTSLIVVTICVSAALSLQTPWKERISAYADLLNCEHVVTTGSRLDLYFPVVERLENNQTFEFMTLTTNGKIKFQLTNERQTEYFEFEIDNTKAMIAATTSRKADVLPDSIRDDGPNHVTVQIRKIGDLEQEVELSVNGVKCELPFEKISMGAKDIRYFSFASGKDGQKQQYFYNCNKNVRNLNNRVTKTLVLSK